MSNKKELPVYMMARLKPHEDIENLISHLAPEAVKKNYAIHREIYLDRKGERLCQLLVEGNVDIYKTGNGLLSGTLKAPFIIGISQPEAVGTVVKLLSATPVTVLEMLYADAMKIIEEHDLWKPYSHYLKFIIGLYHAQEIKPVGLRSEDIIRQCLLDLMNENEEYRLKNNACQYVIEKTSLSRSGIMSVLSRMRSQNMIDIRRGVLYSTHGL